MAVLYLLGGGSDAMTHSPMTCILKNGRVVDPANGRRRRLRHRDPRRRDRHASARTCRARRRGRARRPRGVRRDARPHRHARPPARAGPGAQGDDRHRRRPPRWPGGFTAVACMPNTSPVNDSAAVTRYIREKAEAAGLARVYPIGAASVGSKGEQMAEIGELKAAGCVAVSDDGHPMPHGAADAPRARVRGHARRARDRPLRGSRP